MSADSEAAEELAAIQAIFPELSQDDEDPTLASLDLEVTPASPLGITFKPSFTLDSIKSLSIDDRPRQPANDAEPQYRTHQFSHLPALRVTIKLPPGYPNDEPPRVTLLFEPSWLPASKIKELESQAEELWNEYGRSQVVYAYIDYLQTAIESSFGLSGSGLTLSTSLEQSLLDYQASALKSKFDAQTFDCGVCLYPKKGSVCHAMRGCAHVFCIECLQDFYNSAITEGSVETVQCLDPTCGHDIKLRPRPVHPTELFDIGIPGDQVQRYVNLKLKKMLESDKTTVYCPRPWCQGPARSGKFKAYNTANLEAWPDEDLDNSAEKEEAAKSDAPKNTNISNKANMDTADRLRICSTCSYAFCHVCNKSWHGDYVYCMPRSTDQMSADEKASLDFIRLHTSPCPYCNAATQKMMGCNHMRCSQCQTHFCYLCSAWLHAGNPYGHFNTKGTPCYMRLWELEEGDEGQEGVQFAGARGLEQQVIEFANDVGLNEEGAADDAVDRDGLQRFLAMAANDEEDGWDSDELDVRPLVRRR